MSERDIEQILVGPLPVPSQVGDAAIAAGAVLLLRRAFPHARISGWTSWVDMTNEAAVRSFRETYDVDSVVLSPGSLEGTGHTAAGSLPARAVRALRELSLAVRKYSLPTQARILKSRTSALPLGDMGPIVREIAQADLVVMRGGGYLKSPHIACDLLAFRLNALNEIAIARALGTPYAIWGHTIWDLDGPLSKRILWPLIADSRITVCREQRSCDYLLEQGAPAEKLAVLPDTAFALEPPAGDRVDRILEEEGLASSEGALVGINVRPPRARETDRDDFLNTYMDGVAAAVRYLSAEHGAHSVLVSHCHSTDLHTVPTFQDERGLIRELVERLEGRCSVLQGEYSPSELVGIYGRFSMMFTTRLHAGILSAVAGTPPAVIAYEHNKARGIAEMLGMQDHVLALNDVDSASTVRLVSQVWDARSRCREDLRRALAQIQQQLPEYVRLTLAGIQGDGRLCDN